MSAVIVWFRRDLRLIDHPALDAAVQSGLPIIALYVHAPEEEGEWPSGAATDWWLHHSLAALDAQLRERGGRLIVRRGPVLAAITRLISETGAVAVHWNRLYEPAAIARAFAAATVLMILVLVLFITARLIARAKKTKSRRRPDQADQGSVMPSGWPSVQADPLSEMGPVGPARSSYSYQENS